MKNILYLAMSLFLVLSVQSCKEMGDADNNLLNDMGLNQGGLGEDRFLHQEVTSADTIAEYHYNGRKLVEVIGDSTITTINYSGEQINRIDFVGVVEGDSIIYTQLYNYSPTDHTKLTTITETRSVYEDIASQTAPLVFEKSRSQFDIKFNAAAKLDSVIMKHGVEIPAQTFEFTSYKKTGYTYDALQNVAKVANLYGGLAGNVFLAPTVEESFEFTEYDAGRSPYTLIPFGYLLHKTFENSYNGYRFSPNNPKRVLYSSNQIPVPVGSNTLFTYDALNYAISGWGVNYEYRPF